MNNPLRVIAMAALLAGLSTPVAAFAQQTTVASSDSLQAAYQDKITDVQRARQAQNAPVSFALPIQTAADLRALNFGTPVFGHAGMDVSAVQNGPSDRAVWIGH